MNMMKRMSWPRSLTDSMLNRMSTRPVYVFFYGTIMNAEVLREQGIEPLDSPVAASVAGFALDVRPRPNLIPDERARVYGAVTALTHNDLEKIYQGLRDTVGLNYLPEAVLAETSDGLFRPALCYLTAEMKPGPANPDFVRRLAECVRKFGHLEWYARHVESFGSK
jgi:Gamma-glutamyl cyclotransferase, AIG2-like